MKKILLILSIAVTTNLSAQTYLSLHAHNKGFGLRIGHLESESGIDFSAGYSVPFLKAVNPRIFDLSLGKQFLLTNNDHDNWSLTASLGGAYTTRKDFTEFFKGGEIITISGFKPVVKIEVGKDLHIGRLFATANYCTTSYFGAGMRVFFK